jgi:hypothetical protein
METALLMVWQRMRQFCGLSLNDWQAVGRGVVADDRWSATIPRWAAGACVAGERRAVEESSGAGNFREQVVKYRSLIELRQVLNDLQFPEKTTVVLVLDDRHPVHLPSLIRRDDRAYRLIVSTPARSLLGTTSAGDLALFGQSWGWELVRYEADLPLALRAARETTAADEFLMVLVPAWKKVRCSCG